MLLGGSFLFKVCLVVTLSQVRGQDFEYNEEEVDEHPDYSKYYKVDTSAPLNVEAGSSGAANGFVTQGEFDSFFGPSPIAFGASSNQQVQKPLNSFVPVAQPQATPLFQTDFFEDSQRKQAQKNRNDDDDENPKYISHNIGGESRYSPNVELPAREEDAEEIDVKKKKKDEDFESADEEEPIKYQGKAADYNTGKSSSSVPQYPAAQGFYENFEATTAATPYQKYSFQPTEQQQYKYLDGLISTAAPYNPAYTKHASGTYPVPVHETQATEEVSQKHKGCKKLQKAVSHEDSMNCFVCEDPSNKSKFTQCSYSSEPKPLNYYQGHSERYTIPSNPEGFRYKRSRDPYEFVKSRSQKLNQNKQGDYDFDHLFQYSPDFDTEPKGYSEVQSEELKKNPENCKKVDKDGMTCTVCKNPKTGGNFEQCSYTSEPKDEKYAYVTNKKYDSNDEQPEEEETKTVELQSKKTAAEKKTKTPEYGKKLSEPLKLDNKKTKSSDNKKEATNDEEYSVPQHFIDTTDNQETIEGGLYENDDDNEEKAEENEQQQQEEPEKFEDFEEYHYKIFPQTEESKKQEQQADAEYTPTKSKHDVEEVLAEFTKKDRSKCKKAQKKGMTCYLCVDDKNIKHEECMYVSEPQKSHLAYHGVEETKKSNLDDDEESESKPVPSTIQASSSNQVKTYVRYNPRDLSSSASEKEAEELIPDEEGAFSENTKPTYNKEYNVVLPKYMAVKSNYEKEFDISADF